MSLSGMCTVWSMLPVSPSTRWTSSPLAPHCAGASPRAPVTVQIFWFSYSQLSSLNTPGVQATGRWTVPWIAGVSNGVYQATQSSSSHARTSVADMEVCRPGLPFLSGSQ